MSEQKETSLAQVSVRQDVPTVWWEDKAKLEAIQRAGMMFASSPLVPSIYQGKEGLASCVIALNMAARMKADPLMVMQNMYIVHGRPSWSAKFLVATFNQTGRFTPIRFRWTSTIGKKDWSCQAFSFDKESGEEIDGPVISWAMAEAEGWIEKKGSKWKTLPQLMMMYRAAAWLVNTHAPEISMGFSTTEELEDVYGEERTQGVPLQSTARPAAVPGSRTKAISEELLGVKTVEKPAASLEDMTSKVMGVQSLQDVASVRAELAVSGLDVAQQNELYVLLDQAADQFSQQ